MKKCKTALTLTSLGEYELANALRFAEFRKAIAPDGAALFWAQFEADKASGRLRIQVCNLADVVEEARGCQPPTPSRVDIAALTSSMTPPPSS